MTLGWDTPIRPGESCWEFLEPLRQIDQNAEESGETRPTRGCVTLGWNTPIQPGENWWEFLDPLRQIDRNVEESRDIRPTGA